MNSIAVLGGTFDPIHLGHLELAHTLTNSFHFEKIFFIPCKQNLLKEHSPATAQERIAMIKLAINPYPNYYCDTREIDRDTPSYTIETLKSLRMQYPNHTITFTMGVDSFNTLEQWHYFEDFLKYTHLFVFPRPGYTLEIKPSVQTLLDQSRTTQIKDLHINKHGYIYLSNYPENPISSTGVRAFLKNNASSHLENYLPESVLHYIQSRQLYL